MYRSIKSLFVFLILILTVSGALAADKKNKPEIKTVDNYIAIFDFEVTTGDKGISRPLTESVRREIVLSGKYDVIDRGNMNKILGEQKFQLSGCVAQECIVDVGQLLGVGKIISGTVSIVGKTYYLTLSLISVKTGKIEDVAEDTCRCEIDELLGSTKRLAKKLIGEQVSPAGAAVMKPATAAESKAEAIARAEATARAKSEASAEYKAEAKKNGLKTTTAAIDPSAVSLKIAAPDGHFEKLASGIVRDTQSGLDWYAGPDKNTNWDDAKSWIANLNVDGSGWRMPTIAELKGLYQKGLGLRNITPQLETTGWFVWSGETESLSRGAVALSGGRALDLDTGRDITDYRGDSNYKRVFAVRSRK